MIRLVLVFTIFISLFSFNLFSSGIIPSFNSDAGDSSFPEDDLDSESSLNSTDKDEIRKFVDKGNKPVIVCRSHSCTRLGDRITEAFLFNSLISVFYNAQKSRVSLCEADPNTRACMHTGIRFGGDVGGTPVVVQVHDYTLSDVQIGRKLKHMGFAALYSIYVNGLISNCNTAKSTVEIRDTDTLMIIGNTFLCQLTSDIPSQVFSIYNIDYIDLNYNLIGGYYSFGLSGSSKGQKTGYMLMKFDDLGTGTNKAIIKSTSDSQSVANQRIAPGQFEVESITKDEIEKRERSSRVDKVEQYHFKKVVDQ